MPGSGISADVPNTPAIIDAIATIATTAVPFKATSKRRFPTPTQAQGSLPYLVVLSPTTIGSWEGQQFRRGIIVRMAGAYKPVRELYVYGLWPLRAQEQDATYTTPEAARDLFEQAFTIQYSLNQTCESSDIALLEVVEKMQLTGGHPQPFVAVKMVLHITERLSSVYS